MNADIKIRMIGTGLGISAFIWLIVMDWKIALAVFLMMFGENMSRHES